MSHTPEQLAQLAKEKAKPLCMSLKASMFAIAALMGMGGGMGMATPMSGGFAPPSNLSDAGARDVVIPRELKARKERKKKSPISSSGRWGIRTYSTLTRDHHSVPQARRNAAKRRNRRASK